MLSLKVTLDYIENKNEHFTSLVDLVFKIFDVVHVNDRSEFKIMLQTDEELIVVFVKAEWDHS